uniref:hAT-like transposase RNase-H fold domain-containing protein n=1 Tax=Chenopodium quinoa TaxID=63459 RepID=A0A803NDA0_CHEQI
MSMAHGMKKKHEKYWDNVDNINLMLYVAVVLDPRWKMHYVKWAINDQYDSVKAAKLHDMDFKAVGPPSLIDRHPSNAYPLIYEAKKWVSRASRVRSSVWRVGGKHPGYIEKDSEELLGEALTFYLRVLRLCRYSVASISESRGTKSSDPE